MTKEEALKVLVKMRAWRRWGKGEQNEEDMPEMPEQKEVDEALDVYIEVLSRLSLPSNLDEAAWEYFVKTYGIDNIAISEDIKKAVKFGAEWMAGQGITVTGDTDDEYVCILEDIEKAICKIAPDSTVNVQIRK